MPRIDPEDERLLEQFLKMGILSEDLLATALKRLSSDDENDVAQFRECLRSLEQLAKTATSIEQESGLEPHERICTLIQADTIDPESRIACIEKLLETIPPDTRTADAFRCILNDYRAAKRNREGS